MGIIKNLLAGLGGAIALNILHESFKKSNDDMPRIDLLGEEALQKISRYLGNEITDKDNLYQATLAGDLVSNALYYSGIGMGNPENVWQRAFTLGTIAGVGAITLPQPLGLDAEPVARNNTVKALTVGYYIFGALVTAAILSVSTDEQI